MKRDMRFFEKGSKMQHLSVELLLFLECQSWGPQLYLHISPLKSSGKSCEYDLQWLLEDEL